MLPLATKNRERLDAVDTYAEVVASESNFANLGMDYDMEDAFGAGGAGGRGGGGFAKEAGAKQGKPEDAILDIREYDVPYYLRVAIDKSEFFLFSHRNESVLTSLPILQIFESDYGMK